jgi:glycosyltransferase involved in cell wall biosynthesis
MSEPAVAIAIASRDRPLRLRWLLNALLEQRAPGDGFEVVVAHDPSDAETERALGAHPLRARVRLTTVTFPAHSAFPGAGRNAAWRASAAELILFTDDDCRPDRDWVARAVAAARSHPGAIIQGQTLPDPDEAATLLGAPWSQTMLVTPPTFWAPTCNIAYPRQILEQAGGFDEQLRVGEDTDLAVRARRSGARFVAAPEMLVYHAVEAHWLGAMLLVQARWRDLASLAKRHPEVRRQLWGGFWWKPEHAALVAAAVGAALARRQRLAATAAVPWLALSLGHRGRGPRGLLRSVSELPGRAAIDAAEIVTLARGSIRYRTLIL